MDYINNVLSFWNVYFVLLPDRKLSDSIKNILIYVLKINKGRQHGNCLFEPVSTNYSQQ